MTDTSSDFAAHVLGLLKNSGTTGHSGHGLNKPLNSKEKSGTIREVPLVPVKSDWSRPLRSSGTSFLAEKQSLTNPVTSVTTGTAILQGAADQPENGGAPAEWHAILADLEQQNCPDWLSPDRWNALLADSGKLPIPVGISGAFARVDRARFVRCSPDRAGRAL